MPRNWAGKTSLHLAQSPDIIEMLLQSGADIEIRDLSGYTALHSVACRPEREVLLKKLLEAGAGS
jgi:ankyrin repeat protein